MDILLFGTSIFQGLAICIVAYFGLNFFRQRQKDQKRDDILNLEAKMATLRMFLKAKIKKKSQFIRASIPQAISKGDPIDRGTTELIEIPFETSADFQRYFDLSRQLNNFVLLSQEKNVTAPKPEPLPSTVTSEKPKVISDGNPTDVKATGLVNTNEVKNLPSADSFMTTDLKNELTIIRIIKEIVDLSVKVKIKIDAYNEVNPKKQLPTKLAINFPSFNEVKKIFSHSDHIEVEKTAA